MHTEMDCFNVYRYFFFILRDSKILFFLLQHIFLHCYIIISQYLFSFLMFLEPIHLLFYWSPFNINFYLSIEPIQQNNLLFSNSHHLIKFYLCVYLFLNNTNYSLVFLVVTCRFFTSFCYACFLHLTLSQCLQCILYRFFSGLYFIFVTPFCLFLHAYFNFTCIFIALISLSLCAVLCTLPIFFESQA